MNCWGCYKPVGRLPQQMRLVCLELRQVLLFFRVLRQVNQFYLALMRRTKVPVRLFHQICWNAFLGQHCQVCYATIALIWVTANCMLQSSEHSKVAKCGFLLPHSSVTVSNPDRLLGEGVTLCGHACFKHHLPSGIRLNGCADAELHHGTVKTLGSRRRPWDERAQFLENVIFPNCVCACQTSERFLGTWQGSW